jgi:hypothetical protein
MGWTVLVSNPGGGRDFPYLSRSSWNTPSLLNGYHVSFPGGKGVKRPRCGVDYSFPCSGDLRESRAIPLFLTGPWLVNFTYLTFYPSIRLFYKHSVYHTVNIICIHYKDRLDITPPIILQIVSGVAITTRLRHVACKNNI